MIILHGENSTQTRSHLVEALDQARAENSQVIRLEAKNLNPADLEQAIGATSLFEKPQLIVIEYLHSLPRSKRKNDLIKQLANLAESADESTQIILLEKRSLTKTMLKQFTTAEVKEAKLTKYLFSWLDSLQGGLGSSSRLKNSLNLLDDAISQDGEMMCFIMLARQIRLLIQTKDGGKVAGPPFMVSKLKKQAASFSLDGLLALHQQLLTIDYGIKTSTDALSVRQQLDLFIIKL